MYARGMRACMILLALVKAETRRYAVLRVYLARESQWHAACGRAHLRECCSKGACLSRVALTREQLL
jgi:hypothetical protein